jgi:cyclophilin family peptidyl-prolyl cis-trans isomerase
LRWLAALAVLWPWPALAGTPALPDGLYAEITTPRGVITCELEFTRTPLTVASFVGLAEGTLGPAPRKPFFDGLKFHRVVPNFVIQGGDPLGTGEGGPGYSFPDEFVPGLGNGSVGALAMANDGPDTNGSQFFITLAPAERLNYLHTAFGHAVRGLDVLPRVVQGDPMQVRIIRVGAAALAFRADDAAFKALSAKAPRYAAKAEPGPGAYFDDADKLLPSDPPRAKNFNFKLGNFERATGLKVYGRVFAKFVPGPGIPDPQAFTDHLAQTLAIGDKGVLAVYFADRDVWAIHVGESLVTSFIGTARRSPHTSDKEVLDACLATFLAGARIRAAEYAQLSQKSFTNNLQPPGQPVKLLVDAVLDGIIDKLAPDK